jgi:hypothetical protein
MRIGGYLVVEDDSELTWIWSRPDLTRLGRLGGFMHTTGELRRPRVHLRNWSEKRGSCRRAEVPVRLNQDVGHV